MNRPAKATSRLTKSSCQPCPPRLLTSWITRGTGMIQQVYQAHLSPFLYGTAAMPMSNTPMASIKFPSCTEIEPRKARRPGIRASISSSVRPVIPSGDGGFGGCPVNRIGAVITLRKPKTKKIIHAYFTYVFSTDVPIVSPPVKWFFPNISTAGIFQTIMLLEGFEPHQPKYDSKACYSNN